jgi:UDP-N-acetylmuramoyl-L-alanyl-D-glutamate--2,6-diaminopimelate ligase
MRLDELLEAISERGRPPAQRAPSAAEPIEISSLAYDSRQVQQGALFFCVRGFKHDGHHFAAEALQRRAVALVVDRPLGLGVPEVQVRSVRAAMGPLAARFFGDPSTNLRVVGVTGTNGKTTTAFLVRAALERAGVRCGMLGTVKSVIGGQEQPALRTTPEAIDLQASLRAMLDAGDEACAMEVSSHALALGRTDGLRFAAAIFTNLSQDHLDFHADMEAYFQAKRELFADGEGRAVVNIGDPYGRRLANELPSALSFAVQGEEADEARAERRRRGRGRPEGDQGSQGADWMEARADYLATDVRCGRSGSRFVLRSPGGGIRDVALPLPGRFNVANALAALAAAQALEVHLDAALAGLEGDVRVPGRLEAVDAGQDFAVLVDYAHTPDSLARVSAAARELAAAREDAARQGRVLLVFGAGGDRDRGKRPLMGEAGARGADVLVLTSDNPRSEDPEKIIAEILAGVRQVEGTRTLGSAGQRATESGPGAAPDSQDKFELHVIADRREAIRRAIALARTGDVVVIAGKGHEQGQEHAGGHVIPFDDVTVAREALRARCLAAPGTVHAGVPA